MHVTVTYHDHSSYTKEEVVRAAIQNYGKNTEVKVLPDSLNAHDFVYFGIQQVITQRQISVMFDRTGDYPSELSKLRAEVLAKLEEILDTVIFDNEAKVKAG